jgi:hypothetical protein
MLRSFQSMFGPLAEIVEFHANHMSLTTHPALHRAWESSLSRVIDDIDIEEKEKATTLQNLFTKGAQLFLHRAVTLSWKDLTREEKYTKIRERLERPQIPQRTPAWYAQGKTVLTASEFSTLYGTERAVRQLAFQKVQPPSTNTNRLACITHEMGPFDWGVRFEPVVKGILEKQWGARILEAGRLLHPTDPLLAASPDGLLIDATDDARIGRLLEIKCPITREITETIPFEYWCQMQIQMEVAGIDECEYVEVKLDSITSKKSDLSGAVPEGYIWLFQDTATCKMMYAYSEEEKSAYELQGMDMIEMIPWKVNRLFTKTVTRDRAWFQGTAPMRQKFWETVEKLRTGEIILLESKYKQKQKVTVEKEGCLITNDP